MCVVARRAQFPKVHGEVRRGLLRRFPYAVFSCNEDGERLVLDEILIQLHDLAREHGVSRARVTQVMALLQVHPQILEWVHENPGAVSERRLRP